ncbi:MAG: EAL and HDOD domain-containing protein [Desulfobulbus sp.]|jgi:EAL and modified HD-GYP domain-containing signal transduction protein
MDLYIARQPVLDRRERLFAYEMLYRTDEKNRFPDGTDDNTATQSVLSHLLLNVGLDTLVGRARALINFTGNQLLEGLPSQLPPDRCIVELLESVVPSREVVEACAGLHRMGYRLALDDVDFKTADWQALLPYASIVKVDFRAADQDQLAENLARIRLYPNLRLLAEKVETHEEFRLATSLGFHYFQGYFFSRPEMLKYRRLDTAKVVLLNLLIEICRPEIDLERIERIIAPDASLSYKLLRYINSVYYSLISEVVSIRHALTYLGISGVRQFISLVATTEMTTGKPSELMRLAMVRAELCHSLALFRMERNEASQLFLLGLFSLLDAMLDMPMHEVTASLPLSSALKSGLNEEDGPFFPYLQAVLLYERGEFQACTTILTQLDISPEYMIQSYINALSRANLFERIFQTNPADKQDGID